jgi:hypothetical protein
MKKENQILLKSIKQEYEDLKQKRLMKVKKTKKGKENLVRSLYLYISFNKSNQFFILSIGLYLNCKFIFFLSNFLF